MPSSNFPSPDFLVGIGIGFVTAWFLAYWIFFHRRNVEDAKSQQKVDPKIEQEQEQYWWNNGKKPDFEKDYM